MRIIRAYCESSFDNFTSTGSTCVILTEDNSVIEREDEIIERSTNIRVELQSVINAIESARVNGLQENDHLKVHTTLKMIEDCFRHKWIDKWRKNDWKNSDGKSVKNVDLWERLNSDISWNSNIVIEHTKKGELKKMMSASKRSKKILRSFKRT